MDEDSPRSTRPKKDNSKNLEKNTVLSQRSFLLCQLDTLLPAILNRFDTLFIGRTVVQWSEMGIYYS